MISPAALETEIRAAWDEANQAGEILYRSETLTIEDLTHEDVAFHLIHNSCRDAYDRKAKSVHQPSAPTRPFSDGGNPLLAYTPDGVFKIMGNRFACVQYQCIVVPIEPLEQMTEQFVDAAIQFADEHPGLTLMYNAIGAGKAVPAQYWLLSFASYDALERMPARCKPLIADRCISRQTEPSYALRMCFKGRRQEAVALLLHLARYMGHRNFNIFLFDHHAIFIPREDVEVPMGFDNHRFGGLEMLGCFVMKSLDALKSADPVNLLRGIKEISYSPKHQEILEERLKRMEDT